MRRSDKVVKVKRSCITDKIVWVYIGSSDEGARKAYWRACKKEVRRVRQWNSRMEERKQRLMHIIAICNSGSTSSSSFKRLAPQQRKAARRIVSQCKSQPVQERDFYNHILEEAKWRNLRSNRWKENRIKLFRYGKTHTPCEYVPKKKQC
ncbi:MAG: hypothetical protein ACOCNX_00810 [Prevotella sp.]